MNSNLPFRNDTDVLKSPIQIGGHSIANRLAIQPMEGCDGTSDGSPDELTVRRYRRFAESGAGLMWFEAVAVVNEGRANPRQLFIHKDNADAYKRLVNEIREISQKETGVNPVIIMQGTHSGRYSKPEGKPAPIVARNNPLFEKDNPLPLECIISDDALERLEACYADAAKLAYQSGFDGIDIKACHGYLNNELLSAYTRSGKYGGSFENRTRFFRNAVTAARASVPGDFIVTSRMNIYDGFPYPYGCGVTEDGGIEPDLTEPIQLLRELKFDLVDITMGNPYQNPQVNRPVDMAAVERMCALTKQIQSEFQQMAVVGSGVTFPREKSGELASGYVSEGVCKIVGFGRMAFAYPHFARDILSAGLDKKKVCITCGKCTELMRAGQTTGCVIRDELYTKLYREVIR